MSARLRSRLLVAVALGTVSAAAVWNANQPVPEPEPAGGVVPVLREGAPRYWKGNLHTHSFWSDGDDFPEMIADWYKRHAYHFLALSDHNVLADGERWMKLDDKKNRPAALKKYRERFGPAWVEERVVKGEAQVRLK